MGDAATPSVTHCPGCGTVECAGCLPELDPPRYCVRCGGWLATRVHPLTVVSVCRKCVSAD